MNESFIYLQKKVNLHIYKNKKNYKPYIKTNQIRAYNIYIYIYIYICMYIYIKYQKIFCSHVYAYLASAFRSKPSFNSNLSIADTFIADICYSGHFFKAPCEHFGQNFPLNSGHPKFGSEKRKHMHVFIRHIYLL